MNIQRYDKKNNYSYAPGIYTTVELLLKKPEHATGVILSTRAEDNEGIRKIKDICYKKDIPLEVNDNCIDRISPKENCYALGVFKKYETNLNAKSNHLVLVNPENAGNLGTIIRTMAGFDVTGLAIIRPGVDIFNPDVIRSSMGSLFSINFSYFNDFTEYSKAFKGRNLYSLMTDGKQSLKDTVFKAPFSLVFGSESSGLPDEYHKISTSVNIPVSKNIDSLNLSIAAGIALNKAKNDC